MEEFDSITIDGQVTLTPPVSAIDRRAAFEYAVLRHNLLSLSSSTSSSSLSSSKRAKKSTPSSAAADPAEAEAEAAPPPHPLANVHAAVCAALTEVDNLSKLTKLVESGVLQNRQRQHGVGLPTPPPPPGVSVRRPAAVVPGGPPPPLFKMSQIDSSLKTAVQLVSASPPHQELLARLLQTALSDQSRYILACRSGALSSASSSLLSSASSLSDSLSTLSSSRDDLLAARELGWSLVGVARERRVVSHYLPITASEAIAIDVDPYGQCYPAAAGRDNQGGANMGADAQMQYGQMDANAKKVKNQARSKVHAARYFSNLGGKAIDVASSAEEVGFPLVDIVFTVSHVLPSGATESFRAARGPSKKAAPSSPQSGGGGGDDGGGGAPPPLPSGLKRPLSDGRPSLSDAIDAQLRLAQDCFVAAGLFRALLDGALGRGVSLAGAGAGAGAPTGLASSSSSRSAPPNQPLPLGSSSHSSNPKTATWLSACSSSSFSPRPSDVIGGELPIVHVSESSLTVSLRDGYTLTVSLEELRVARAPSSPLPSVGLLNPPSFCSWLSRTLLLHAECLHHASSVDPIGRPPLSSSAGGHLGVVASTARRLLFDRAVSNFLLGAKKAGKDIAGVWVKTRLASDDSIVVVTVGGRRAFDVVGKGGGCEVHFVEDAKKDKGQQQQQGGIYRKLFFETAKDLFMFFEMHLDA